MVTKRVVLLPDDKLGCESQKVIQQKVAEEEEQSVSEHYVPLPHGGALSSSPSTGNLQRSETSPGTKTRRWTHPHQTLPLNWTTTTPSGNQPGDRQAQKCV